MISATFLRLVKLMRFGVVLQEVGVALLQEEDVGLVLPEEGHARRVDGAQLLPVHPEVVLDVRGSLVQGLEQVVRDSLIKKRRRDSSV